MNISKQTTSFDFVPGQPMGEFQIYIDHNDRSMPGTPGRSYFCSKVTLEAAIAECERITRESLLVLCTPHMSAADLNYAYLKSGADPFIVGVPRVPFSAWAFARDCYCEITGETIEPPLSHHPCDKKPPPHLSNNPTAKPVIGTWRKDARCIHHLPNPHAKACRLAEMQGESSKRTFLNSLGEAFTIQDVDSTI